MNKKHLLRKLALKRRGKISDARRKKASEKASCTIHSQFQHQIILSYSSFRGELDLNPLNQSLASQNQLVLPRVEGKSLTLYLVNDWHSQLLQSKWGIWEPNPATCLQLSLNEVDVILVPGLAFDKYGARLGYGGGYYDRLLSQTKHSQTFGVGFHEQKSHPIPADSWDVSLSDILTF